MARARVQEVPLYRLTVTVFTPQAQRATVVAFGKTEQELKGWVGPVDEPGWTGLKALVRQSPEMYTSYLIHV